MPKFAELWVYLLATPLLGLTATLVVYTLGASRLHPSWTGAVDQPGPLDSDSSCQRFAGYRHAYPSHFAGAQFIQLLLGPAVVALAWPLWLRREELRQRWGRLLIAAMAGGVAASGSALLLAWALGLPASVILSLVPKSVTAPVAQWVSLNK